MALTQDRVSSWSSDGNWDSRLHYGKQYFHRYRREHCFHLNRRRGKRIFLSPKSLKKWHKLKHSTHSVWCLLDRDQYECNLWHQYRRLLQCVRAAQQTAGCAGSGSVGIGTTTPVSGLELYNSAASDRIFTITSATATNDPLVKFRTGTTPAVQFSLGVDTSDSNTFKIDSNDGLTTSPDFKIDSTGQTTIANAVLGAQSFPEDAGIVSWVDMSVTISSADNTVESYSAQMDAIRF